ncbi:uncharacterized protein LOC121424262 [Lytechinus variegatus]|uniref:uncharacterized protein LOC121424262 n=1 Tax=Lytechinus variegatus TaxID=7654 RepID=UPI001BB237A0|nr:uncharacterized protein LOC121424262 [Lytechinus variegatus]
MNLNRLSSYFILICPEAPSGLFVSSVTHVSVSLTLTSPSSPHDGYELYKLDPTDNHRALVSNLTRENNGMIYETDIVGLVPATLYNVEVGTFLNAEGSFPMQRSEENATVTFMTGNAGVQSPESTMLLISLLAYLATVLLI